jgi:hypothetical protein
MTPAKTVTDTELETPDFDEVPARARRIAAELEDLYDELWSLNAAGLFRERVGLIVRGLSSSLAESHLDDLALRLEYLGAQKAAFDSLAHRVERPGIRKVAAS